MYKCIDISSNNGVLDWDRIKADGIDCAIIRIGFGSDYANQDDSQAERNMSECERLGIPYGVYLYSYALDLDDARSEAAHTLRVIDGYNPTLGVWFDMEDADGYKANHGLVPESNGELLTDFCIEYMQIIKDAGYMTGVYANHNYFSNILNDSRLTSFDGFNRWLAIWGPSEPSMPCLLWQYSSDGKVDGSSERTDMNWYYGELSDIEASQPERENPIEDTDEEACSVDNQDYKHSEGEFVCYSKLYASSTSENGLTPCEGFTSGMITKIVPGARNPYLINNGTGWVNDEVIYDENTVDTESDASVIYEQPEAIQAGDKVKVLVNGMYEGGSFMMYYDQYDVIEVNGDRAVIGIGDTVTCAIHVNNIAKIK